MVSFPSRRAWRWIVPLAVLAGLGAAAASFLHLRALRYHRYDAAIRRCATRHAIPPELVWAVTWKESRFDPDRVGRAGEIGLMQVRRDAAAEWAKASGVPQFNPSDLFDPGTNIAAGTWYLARSVERWIARPDPFPYALAEYNAGRANARRWAALAPDGDTRTFLGQVSYGSTRRYIADVLNRCRGDF